MFGLSRFMFSAAVMAAVLIVGCRSRSQKEDRRPAWIDNSVVKMETELAAKYGAAERPRIQRGLKQVAEFWIGADGDAGAFEEFVRKNFAGDQAAVDTLFTRCQRLFEQIDGHMTEIRLG